MLLAPDGQKIAYVWRHRHAVLADKLAKGGSLSAKEVATETETFLVVASADGSGARTVAAVKCAGVTDRPFQGIDWR